MLWLRSCPRCGGDLFEDSGERPAIVKCFQCSRVLTADAAAAFKASERAPRPLRRDEPIERAA